jgi:hypothetical protein
VQLKGTDMTRQSLQNSHNSDNDKGDTSRIRKKKSIMGTGSKIYGKTEFGQTTIGSFG